MRSLKILLMIILIIILTPGLVFAEEYLIKISFSEFKLFLFDSEGQELLSFPVALPKITPKNLPIKGKVVRIEKNPYWFPTLLTRKAYLRKKKIELPKMIGPGDSRNAMGMAKIIVLFETPEVNQAIRIHGTNDKDSIGKRISRGCYRLYNEDILTLIDSIKNKPTRVILD
ncbi:L,D-transpeptidase [Patescibacteria group bacterium]|nr:L,D-transpeptidase [Patescibacteria group bacterium]MBU2263467.1 L,D-transpeptidase [Patescibacteria group bacterium]